MSINGPNAVAGVTPSKIDTKTSVPTAAAGKTSPAVPVDALTDPPAPPRFPWLSRLSQQLETASRQRAPFASAPVLGDHLDKSV